MVQSLVPIWEEEYERSGIQEGAKQDDPNKPLPDDVLRSFMHGLDYDRTLSQLFMEICNSFPSKVHVVDGNDKLDKYIKSFGNISRKIEPIGDQGQGSPCDLYLVRDEGDRSRGTSSSLCFIKEDLKDPDTETLGLLRWLASSEAEEELDAGDELLHEAILCPLLPAKSYRAAFEIAHRDYEHASQRECQDILDSVEGIVKSKRSTEQASFSSKDLILDSFQGILKSEGSKEQASSSFPDQLDAVSSGSSIPQVGGSFDNNCHSEKGNISETNMYYGEEKSTAKPMGKGPRIGSKGKENKLLWGTLPFSVSKSEPEAFELFCHVSSCDKMINDGFYSPSFHSKEGSCYDLKNKVAICSEKGGKALALCSVRDLMRKKRCLLVEQPEAEVEKNEDMASCWNEGVAPGQTEELTSNAYDKGSLYSVPAEEPSLQQSTAHQNVQGSGACSTICSSGFQGIEGFEHRLSSCYSLTFQNSFSSLLTDMVQSRIVASDLIRVNQGSTMKEQIRISTASLKLPAGDLSMPETESKKLDATFSGECKVEEPASPPNIMKYHSTNHKKKSTENEVLKSLTHENWNAGSVANTYRSKTDDDIAREVLSKMHLRSCQQLTCILDNDSKDFGKEKTSQEFIKMAFVSKPPTNEHIHGPEETSVADQSDGNIDKSSGMQTILSFFPRISQDSDFYDQNVSWSPDCAHGVPTHFQNDGTVLYLLTHALPSPTLNSLNDWLLGGIKQHFLLDATGASKECLDKCSDGVVNEGAACCRTTPLPIKDAHSEYDASQSSEERCSLEREYFHPNISHFSCEPKLGTCLAKEKVTADHLHDLPQISGPEKYENCYPTPLSQIGFRDPASIGGGQQLTLLSMELQAESRGDLRPDPKFDAINVLSLVVQEDASNMHQVYVLLRVIGEKPGEKNGYGVSDCNLFLFPEEKMLLEHFVEIISSLDPDIFMGWEIQSGSLGYLAERALHLGMNLLKKISRTPFHDPRDKLKDSGCPELSNLLPDVSIAKTFLEDSVIEDDWGRAHASGVHVGGRIVLNIWRLMRAELKLNIYTAEAVAEGVLRLKIPLFSNRILNQWYLSGIGKARYKCIEYAIQRAKLNIQIMDQLDMINRTSELARIFGIDFFSVISRGSQYRVESMLLRLAHTQNYLAISPGYQQVASQPAMECLPLVMEPESGFYIDPVVVLDFQSLYPSMIIAYNLCFCTCLGNVICSRANVLGVSSYSPDIEILKDLREKLLLTPNGVMYVPSKVCKGVLPRLLEEILSTRIMVKQAMKKLTSSQQILHRILNARQLALKLIANVTYGYTAAGFSGRMPCAEIADSIVQCGRRTLETAISFVNQHERWKAKVIYGDTDSMFVLLKGRSKEDAFRIGHEIAYAITTMNPDPVTLKMEKVYYPCFLLTKKRYVGYSYKNPEQEKPTFDAKGIETVRRDTCLAVAKTLERSLRLMFESQNLSEVKSYLQRQWSRILSGRISLKDFVFAKEVRLGTYSSRASSLPPAAIAAMKDMQLDPRAEPRYGERVPYVVVHGEPGSRLMDMVVNPFELLDVNSPYRLNDLYYINKQIIPALQRVFGLLGADVKEWFSEIPRPTRPMLAKRHTPMFHVGPAYHDDNDNPVVSKKPQAKRSRIDTYYYSKHCTLCGELIHSSDYFCAKCLKKESLVAATVVGKTSKKERQMQHLAEICCHCGGGDWIVERGVKCISLACSVFYETQKVQKELLSLSSFARAVRLYPSCNAELF